MNWNQNSGGFSLLELMFVLVLVAIISATVVVKWSGVRQTAGMDAAIAKIEFCDAHLRRYSHSHNAQCNLVFNLAQSKMQKQYRDPRQSPSWESLGSNIRITDLHTNDANNRGNQTSVVFERNGTTQSYGIELTGPGQRRAWLLIAGASGQFTRLKNTNEYYDALQILSNKP